MLPANAVINLDNLSTIGVLDYDAAAYLAGSRPRYYGAPVNGYAPIDVPTPMDYADFSYNQNSRKNSFGIGTFFKGLLTLGGIYLGGKLLWKIGGKRFKSFFSPKTKMTEAKEKVLDIVSETDSAGAGGVKKGFRKRVSEFWNKLIKNRHVIIPGRRFKF